MGTSSLVRIIGGQLKGRTISVQNAPSLRPTSHKAREALFAILGLQVEGATMADFFSGTGAVGLEALSRGAARVAFVDHHHALMTSLSRTLSQLDLLSQALILTEEIRLAIRNPNLLGWRPFDVIFLDPPYQFPGAEHVLMAMESAQILKNTGIVIYEHFHKTTPPATVGSWTRVRSAQYGDTGFSFYRDQREREHSSTA